jgi:hypothetical protein
MLHPVYYIIQQDMLKNADIPGTENVLVLQAHVDRKGNLAKTFCTANSLPATNRFCLSIAVTDVDIDTKADDIISFFFFPNYHEQNGAPEIILHHVDLKKLNASIDILISAAKAHGFASIHIRHALPPGEDVVTISDPTVTENLRFAYNRIWEHAITFDHALFVQISRIDAIPILDRALQEWDETFRQTQPSFYKLKERNKRLSIQLRQAEQLAYAAAQEIKTQASHISTLRTQSQATFLQNYYNNEYEILPLWYKRFGHLIKAITGKRTFRSLFSDNEKKYKP